MLPRPTLIRDLKPNGYFIRGNFWGKRRQITLWWIEINDRILDGKYDAWYYDSYRHDYALGNRSFKKKYKFWSENFSSFNIIILKLWKKWFEEEISSL